MSDELKRNPMGWMIALFMFLVMIYWWSSISGVSPITNSSISNQLGCNTCGPGGTPGGAWIILKPFAPIAIAAAPALLFIGYAQNRNRRMRMPRMASMELEETEEPEEDVD